MKPKRKAKENSSELRILLGKKIRRMRLTAGLTIEELAFRAGVHHNYLGDVERGRRNLSLKNLEKLAGGLKVSIAEFFSKAETGTHDGKDEKIYDFIRPLVRLVKNSARGDRDYILSVAKSLAARLKKNRRA